MSPFYIFFSKNNNFCFQLHLSCLAMFKRKQLGFWQQTAIKYCRWATRRWFQLFSLDTKNRLFAATNCHKLDEFTFAHQLGTVEMEMLLRLNTTPMKKHMCVWQALQRQKQKGNQTIGPKQDNFTRYCTITTKNNLTANQLSS